MNTLNLIKQFGQLVIANMIPLLFLLALTIICVTTFLGFGMIIGLYSVGAVIILIVLIAVNEQGKQPPK